VRVPHPFLLRLPERVGFSALFGCFTPHRSTEDPEHVEELALLALSEAEGSLSKGLP
jgi:hypothetical protein